MKRLNLLNALLFGLTAVMWLYNGVRDQNAFDFVLALVWLSGSVTWLIRFFKERNDSEKEN